MPWTQVQRRIEPAVLSRRSLCHGALAAVLLPQLSACTREVALPLKVGTNAWVGYDPLALARDQQMMDARRVKIIGLSSSSETLRLLRNGLLDGGALTLDETLRLTDQGYDVRVVALLDASTGADVILGDPSVQRISDLRGRAVAVESTTVGALMLRRMLAAGGLQPDEVQAIHLEAPQHLDALRSGRVLAAVSYEPVASLLRQQGYHDLFDSRAMPGDILDVLVLRAEVLEQRHDDAVALLTGWNRSLAAFLREPEEVARIMAPVADLSPQAYGQVLRQLDFIRPRASLDALSGDPPALAKSSASLARTLQEMDLIRQAPDWLRLVAPAPAAAALALEPGVLE